MTEAEARQAAKLRRERDLYPLGTAPPKEEPDPPEVKPEAKTPPEGEPKPEVAPAEPFVDPQLKRAIEYLEEKINSGGAKQGKA
jgi:hypothetical protein